MANRSGPSVETKFNDKLENFLGHKINTAVLGRKIQTGWTDRQTNNQQNYYVPSTSIFFPEHDKELHVFTSEQNKLTGKGKVSESGRGS